MVDHIIQGVCKVAKGERMWWIISFRGVCKVAKGERMWRIISFRGCVKWPKVRECGGSYHSGGV